MGEHRMAQRVFVGYDTREDIAFQVCEYSIKRFNEDIHVIPLCRMTSPKKNLLERLIS